MDQNPYSSPQTPDNDEPKKVRINPTPGGEHIWEAMELAKSSKTNEQDFGAIHVTARDLCCAILDLAFKKTKFDESGFTAVLYLEKLKITSSEYVGRAIYDLIEIGGMVPDENDSIEDFSELFDTSLPIEQWGIGWKPNIAG